MPWLQKCFWIQKPLQASMQPKEYEPDRGMFMSRSFSFVTGVSFPAKAVADLLFLIFFFYKNIYN